MKTSVLYSTLVTLFSLGIFCIAHAQSTQNGLGVAGHSPAGPPATHYLGWDNTSTISLEVRNDANFPIEWCTNGGSRKMILNESLMGQTINGYGGLDLTGFLGVGNFVNSYTEPAAHIHIEEGASVVNGFRPMMKDGFCFTREESPNWRGFNAV